MTLTKEKLFELIPWCDCHDSTPDVDRCANCYSQAWQAVAAHECDEYAARADEEQGLPCRPMQRPALMKDAQ